MIYTVALTIIMQNVFAFTTSTENVVTRRLIKLAIKTFLESRQQEIISSIKDYTQRLRNYGRDSIVQKMTELIKLESNEISPQKLAEIKTQLRDFEIIPHESW
jgi:hypothetical protein